MVNGARLRAIAGLSAWAATMAAALALYGCGMRCYKSYDVASGETLSSICRKYGLTENEIRKSNRIGPDYQVLPGDRLFLPCEALERTVRTGTPEPPARILPHAASPETSPPPVTAKGEKPPPVSDGKGWSPGWPVEGKLLRKFSEGNEGGANGIDIKTPDGAAVTASDEGRVSYAGAPADAYGPMVILAHENGFYTVYSHLGEISVKTGEKLYRGQRLGKAGEDSYVHFEIRDGRRPLDPLLYLPKH